MTTQTLQKIIVRMLFDQTFCNAIYADPASALGPVQIEQETRDWLRQTDRRRWNVDTARCARTLSALLEEYPSSAVLCSQHTELNALLSFFESRVFHDAIMNDVSLALAFGAWLSTMSYSDTPMVRLEICIAQRRRLRPHSGSDSLYCLSNAVDVLAVAAGTLARYQAIQSGLPTDPKDRVEHIMTLSARKVYSAQSVPVSEREFLIVDLTETGGVGDASEDLYKWLKHFRHGLSHQEMLDMSENMGLNSTESVSLVNDMVADGLIAINEVRPL
ncbi:MAG: hypothetical protein CMH52_13250 [Myxococcales bacterium]|nr:hypothetical protein [Myxococcales bacterium]